MSHPISPITPHPSPLDPTRGPARDELGRVEPVEGRRTPHALDWAAIDDVLLDMDGTLLDRDFDNFFFEEELPRRYAIQHGLPIEESRDRLFAMYQAVEGELLWTDLHYWSRTLGMDVVALTEEHANRIAFLPGAEEFLRALRASGKRVSILTNAHEAGVSIKVARTGIDRYVDRIINAFEVGYLKMRAQYWPRCQKLIGFDPARSLYVDDDEACLAAGQQYGVGHVFHRSTSSSRLPPQPSSRYRSIETLHVLLSGLP
jgi:HAD superfamily hydrolase (TIGR01509 family)